IDKRGVSKIKEHLLASCYLACLRLADEHQLDTIVFCCISTGEFNFPNQRAAEIAIQDRKSTRLNSSHVSISYAVFCLKKKHLTRLWSDRCVTTHSPPSSGLAIVGSRSSRRPWSVSNITETVADA